MALGVKMLGARTTLLTVVGRDQPAVKLREAELKAARLAALLARGWVEKTSRTSGKTYYFHAADNKTLWALPHLEGELDESAAAALAGTRAMER